VDSFTPRSNTTTPPHQPDFLLPHDDALAEREIGDPCLRESYTRERDPQDVTLPHKKSPRKSFGSKSFSNFAQFHSHKV
jgi:hypothetical protein